jgi:hypothetical protein
MSPSTPLNGPTWRGTIWANYDVSSSVNSIYTVLFWYQCPKLSGSNRARHPISDKSKVDIPLKHLHLDYSTFMRDEHERKVG